MSGPRSPSDSSAEPGNPVINIANDGDIIVAIEHSISATIHKATFRLSTTALKASSRYFATLLDGRFGEARQIQQQHAELRQQYSTFADVSNAQLPSLHIEELGRISAVKSIEPLLSDFFAILHGKDTQAPPPASNLANLAVVADRFDAVQTLQAYAQRKKLLKIINTKTTSKQEQAFTEDKLRQRAWLGLMFDTADQQHWLQKYTVRLITKAPAATKELSDALWWDLPRRIENEIAVRREYVLATVEALQSHFVETYSSRTRQCRLGYDSSGVCDSFQLGEMVRFFLKVGTLRISGNLLAAREAQSDYDGDLFQLLERMKQTPEYQVNSHHTHCGIRTRIVPLLNLIIAALADIGISSAQWQIDSIKHSWAELKRPLVWRHPRYGPPGSAHDEDSAAQDAARALFMATSREWE